MMLDEKQTIPIIAALLGFGEVAPNWGGIDPVLPILERMRQEGCVVVIKLDGERTGANDTGAYTVVVTGAPLGNDFLRIDHRTIEDALAWVIVRYAARKWGYRPIVADA